MQVARALGKPEASGARTRKVAMGDLHRHVLACVLRAIVVPIALLQTVLSGCGGSGGGSDSSRINGAGSGSADGGSSSGPVSGKIVGAALDAQGHPLSGANVTVCNPVFYNSCLNGQTGADGRYAIDLQPNNVWTVYGSITKEFNGQSYCLDLEASSGETFSSSSGAVRDFRWKVTGKRPDRTATDESMSYYGAALNVSDNTNLVLDDHYIEVTLVPQGPLVDGSTGQTLTAMAGSWKWFQIGNIPLGRYSVSAAYVPPSGMGGALVVSTSPSAGYAASAVVDFAPSQGGTCLNPAGAIHVNIP